MFAEFSDQTLVSISAAQGPDEEKRFHIHVEHPGGLRRTASFGVHRREHRWPVRPGLQTANLGGFLYL